MRVLLVGLLFVGLGGCRSVPHYMREVSNAQAITAPPDRAVVVFVRSSGTGFAVRGHIMDDQANFLGTSIAGGHFSVARPPGKQRFIVWSESTDVLVADLAPGLVYFVEVNPAMGVLRSRFTFKASHRGTELFPFRPEWLEDTTRYEVDEALAREETRDETTERRGRLTSANVRLAELTGPDLLERTLSPDDGHQTVGVPGGLAAPGVGAQPPRAFARGTVVRVKLKSGVVWLGEVVTETTQGLLVSTGTATQMLTFADAETIEILAAKP